MPLGTATQDRFSDLAGSLDEHARTVLDLTVRRDFSVHEVAQLADISPELAARWRDEALRVFTWDPVLNRQLGYAGIEPALRDLDEDIWLGSRSVSSIVQIYGWLGWTLILVAASVAVGMGVLIGTILLDLLMARPNELL